MNFFDKLYNIFFKKDNTTHNTETTRYNNIDLLISLNHNFEIDLSLYVDPKFCGSSTAPLLTAEFLHIINSGKLKKQIMSMLDEQIRDKDNSEFVNNVFSIDELIDKTYSIPNQTTDTFIKPSNVFAKNAI